MKQLGDPSDTETYKRVLAALESDDRIPHCRLLGYTDDGDMLLYNFWKDCKLWQLLVSAICKLYCQFRNISHITHLSQQRTQKDYGVKLL